MKSFYDVILRRVRIFPVLYIHLIRTDVVFQGLVYKNVLLFCLSSV